MLAASGAPNHRMQSSVHQTEALLVSPLPQLVVILLAARLAGIARLRLWLRGGEAWLPGAVR